MKIHSNSIESINSNQPQNKKSYPSYLTPSFKGGAGGFGGALGILGSAMQYIEDKGFLASFLIQDVLGMTVPRVGAAFLRDKEVTGHYNTQEGLEVLGREGLTGPCMMAVAPLGLLIATRFGKSTSVNSKLIKRFGNSLKEIVSRSDFDRTLLKNKEKFKQEFYKTNIKEMLSNTLGKEHVKDDSIKYIMEQLANYEKIPANAELKGLFAKNKYRKQCMNNVIEYINNIKYSTSGELELLNKLKIGSKSLDNIQAFSTKEALESMMKYCDDAITLNKNVENLNEAMADNIKNASIAKRFITNVSLIASTLGVLAVLPKLYIRSNISPGARTAMQLKQNNTINDSSDTTSCKKDISFKGKKPNKSLLAKFGKFISKHTNEKFSSELEYNGHNFTPTLMAGLSIFGLLPSRIAKAYSRAQKDESGKKDLTELWEILIRDVSSSLAVVFAVPMLTRACVTAYEDKNGFVLMHKDRTKSKWTSFFDLLNPYSKAHVLTNAEINSIYNNINTKDKMLNFCEYINKNGGDLQKILSKSENIKLIEENGLKLADLSKLSKKDKNKKVKEFVQKLGKDSDDIISKIMSANKPKGSAIRNVARNLNSLPGAIATFLITPYLLGWFIPRLTYANTRRLQEKAEKERKEKSKINTAV